MLLIAAGRQSTIHSLKVVCVEDEAVKELEMEAMSADQDDVAFVSTLM